MCFLAATRYSARYDRLCMLKSKMSANVVSDKRYESRGSHAKFLPR